ncbi:hypothetical protein K490DRAFT_58506 [Saccharata proteae CBS 121410]|uniref:Uncharacterized protein n=1 Tax=Saccharata proteae CBS 121410 TaxID=1314787 RepID=A0A9P4HU23_9PEZI|nr:hypothetical protein K490DRAFT_58506 [Saccharata proteae CBS 121410]
MPLATTSPKSLRKTRSLGGMWNSFLQNHPSDKGTDEVSPAARVKEPTQTDSGRTSPPLRQKLLMKRSGHLVRDMVRDINNESPKPSESNITIPKRQHRPRPRPRPTTGSPPERHTKTLEQAVANLELPPRNRMGQRQAWIQHREAWLDDHPADGLAETETIKLDGPPPKFALMVPKSSSPDINLSDVAISATQGKIVQPQARALDKKGCAECIWGIKHCATHGDNPTASPRVLESTTPPDSPSTFYGSPPDSLTSCHDCFWGEITCPKHRIYAAEMEDDNDEEDEEEYEDDEEDDEEDNEEDDEDDEDDDENDEDDDDEQSSTPPAITLPALTNLEHQNNSQAKSSSRAHGDIKLLGPNATTTTQKPKTLYPMQKNLNFLSSPPINNRQP